MKTIVLLTLASTFSSFCMNSFNKVITRKSKPTTIIIPPQITKEWCKTPIDILRAIKQGNLEQIQIAYAQGQLLISEKRNEHTLLYYAFKNNHLKIIQFLRKNGATLNEQEVKEIHFHLYGTPIDDYKTLSSHAKRVKNRSVKKKKVRFAILD